MRISFGGRIRAAEPKEIKKKEAKEKTSLVPIQKANYSYVSTQSTQRYREFFALYYVVARLFMELVVNWRLLDSGEI